MSWFKQLSKRNPSKGGTGMEERRMSVAELHRLLDQHLSSDGLHDLCRVLNIDYENLPSEGKAGKARELIAYLDRAGRLTDLLKACKRLRPDIAWDNEDIRGEVSAPDTSATPEDVPHEENGPELRVGSSSIHSGFVLDYNFLQFRKFMQEAFTFEELLKFINRSEDFKEYGFNLPLNANHNSVTRELLEYAQRRNKAVMLLEQLGNAKPKLYEKYGPFIDSGQLNVNVTLVIKGDVTLLKTLAAKPLGKEFEQEILQACEQAFFQAI